MNKAHWVGLVVGLLISGMTSGALAQDKTGSQPITIKNNEVPIVKACKARGDLDIFVLSPATDSSETAKATERVILEIPTSARQEYKSYWDRDGSIVFGSGPDGDCWTKFGKKEMNGGRLVFKQDGERSAWVNLKDMILYEEIEGKDVAIAQIEYSRPYKLNSGVEGTANMTKRIGKGQKWCFGADDGKIYLQEDNGKITPIGWMDWRIVTPPKGDKLIVAMTKGTKKNAKWEGKHDGKLYIEK